MARRRTADSAVVRKAKKERKYGLQRQLRTEANRKRKRAKHAKAIEKKRLKRGADFILLLTKR